MNDSQRVQSFIQMGYTRAQVHQCMDLMFAAGEDMNDNKKVKEFLHRMKSGEVADSKTSKSSVKATQSEAATVTRPSPTSSTPTTNNNTTTSTSTFSDSSVSVASGDSASSGSGASKQEAEAKKGDQPLNERLEEATKVPAKIVMPVLIKWCRNYSDERTVLFESKALQQLFANYLKDLLKMGHTLSPSDRQEYEQPMNELLRLAVNKNELADVITSQLAQFVSAASSMQMQSGELANVAETFGMLLVAKIRKFHRATTYDEDLPNTISQLSKKLSETASTCKEVEIQLRGDVNNLAVMFEMRDLRSEMSELLTKKAELLSSLGNKHDASGPGYTKPSSNKKSSKSTTDVKTDTVKVKDLTLLISTGFSSSEIQKATNSQESAQSLNKKIHAMTTKQEKTMAPVMTSLTKAQQEKRDLKEKSEALRKELAEVDIQLEISSSEEEKLLIEQSRLEKLFDDDMSSLNGQNDGLVSQLRRAESQVEVVRTLRHLDEEILNISTVDSFNSQKGKKKRSQEKKVLAMLEGSGGVFGTRKAAIHATREYVESESNCMNRIRQRITEAKSNLERCRKELEQISKLGLGKVEIHLRATLEEQSENMSEDQSLLHVLEGKARDMLTAIQSIVASVVGEEGAVVDGELAVVIQTVKDGFISLECCGAAAADWPIPKAPRGRETSNSGGGFDTDRAAALGLSALIPKYDASTKEGESKGASKKPEKKKSAPPAAAAAAAAAASTFKGWGAPAKAKDTSQKSLATIQAEEMLAKGN